MDQATAPTRTAIVLSFLLLACGGDDGKSDARSLDAGTPTPDAGPLDQNDEDGVPCTDATPRHPVGLTATTASGVQAKVVAANFDPPQKYQNTWTIALTKADGTPLTGADIAQARTWMPVHQHDGGFTPTVMETQPGTYTFTGFYFTMTGPWQVQFEAGASAASLELVSFDVCVGQ